jgi:hypothetical protein
MAKNKDDNTKSNIRFNALKKIAGLIQSNTDDIYKSTYYTDPENKRQLDNLKNNIDTSIKNILNNNINSTGEPNMSRFYERLFFNTQNDKDTVAEFEKIFGDNDFINNLSSSYMDNRWIKAIDDELDETLRYMPKLEEALQTLRDNVLSADSFNKDFLTLKPAIDGDGSQDQFDHNIQDLKKNYDLLKLINDIYYDTSKYGETFIYCVPYEKAIQNLMDHKNDNRGIAIRSNYNESAVILEDTINDTSEKIDMSRFNLDKMNEVNDINLNFEIDNSGILRSVIESEKDARDKRKMVNEQSLCEQYLMELGMTDIRNDGKAYAFDNVERYQVGGKLPEHHNFDKTLNDDMELPNIDSSASDGLVNTDKAKNVKLKSMNGCIVKKLRRECVTPIMINDICLGYYYFEFDNNMAFFDESQPSTGMVNTITGLRSNGRAEAYDVLQRRDDAIRYVASMLATKIDTKFINDNQDLKREIYYILKYNDEFSNNEANMQNIRVSYIPPEDINHIYFELDENTSRGISDLNLALIPAKLWVAIYITNCLAIMTRGNDKRVYYVRQSVESNISKTLLKTVNEIKKSNFGIRQIQNINNVLNITGRFNDYIIPRGADGNSPIEFEVMQGQQIEIKTELLNLLEEAAINSTGVPLELIQSRQSPDYAMQLTMSNTKFLRFVYGRQSLFQQMIQPLLTKIYDIEYGTTDSIDVTLPPPLFINVTNTNQLIVNTSDFCNSIVEIFMGDSQDDIIKAKVGKKLKAYYLGSYVNMGIINNAIEEAKQEKAKEDAEAAAKDNGDSY